MSAVSSKRQIPLAIIVVAGCAIAAITFGTRGTLGLFTLPMTSDMGWSRESYGLAMAIQNLVWGFAQPIAGRIADRHGTARVLAIGGAIYVAGLVGMAFSPSEGVLYLTAGIVLGIGIGTASYIIVLAAFGRAVPREKRAFVYGIATAVSSFGQFVFAPLGQAFISNFGWQTALIYLAILLSLIIPISLALWGKAAIVEVEIEDALSFRKMLAHALDYGSYRLLFIGFFACGFHLAFVTFHMPAFITENGLSAETSSWAIALIGLVNIAGSFVAGWLGDRLPRRYLLSAVYFSRAVVTIVFVMTPVSATSALAYAIAMGMIWMATVPLSAGLVSLFFGAGNVGMLYGMAFLSNRIGSFIGVWLGGLVHDLTGSYDLMWYLCAVLGVCAALLHLPIREAPAPDFRPEPA